MASLRFCAFSIWLMLLIFTLWTAHSQWTAWGGWESTLVINGFKRSRDCSVEPPNSSFCEGSNEDFATKVAISRLREVGVSLLRGKIRVGRYTNKSSSKEFFDDCRSIAKDRMTISALTVTFKAERCTVIEGTFQLVELPHSVSLLFHYNILQNIRLNESLSYQMKEQQFGIVQCIEECLLNDDCYGVTYSVARRNCYFYHGNYTIIQLDAAVKEFSTWMKAKGPTSPMYANRLNPSRPIEFEKVYPYAVNKDTKKSYDNQNPSQCLEICHQDKDCMAMQYSLQTSQCVTVQTKILIGVVQRRGILSWFKVTDAPIFQVRKDEKNGCVTRLKPHLQYKFVLVIFVVCMCIISTG